MADSHDATQSLTPGQLFGRFEIVRLLGRGGMGAVYEARNTKVQKRVALKVLTGAMTHEPTVRERFMREGRIASQLEHPNIVQVFDCDVERDVPFLVMELLQGETLAALIGREGAMPVERIVALMLPVLAAIAAAHDAGIVHRDIKPENIFLSRQHRGAVVPKVLDFGISKFVAGGPAMRLTATNAMMGTVYYMSPSQAEGAANAGPEDDQYALGVVLYECATSVLPFDGETFLAVIHAIRSAPLVPPRQLRPELSEAFEAVVLRAMDRRPAHRFASVRELARALLPFAAPGTRADWEAEFAPPALAATSLDAPHAAGIPGDPTTLYAPALARPTTLRGSSRKASAPAGSATRRWLAVAGAVILALVACAVGVVVVPHATPPARPAIARVDAPAVAPRDAAVARVAVQPVVAPRIEAPTVVPPAGEGGGTVAIHAPVTAPGAGHRPPSLRRGNGAHATGHARTTAAPVVVAPPTAYGVHIN